MHTNTTAAADDFVTLYVTRASPVHLPLPKGSEPGASGVEKDMLLPGANRVRRSFMEKIANNPGIKIFWKARILTFDPPADVRELGDLRSHMEERRVKAEATTGPSADADVNPFAGKPTAEALAMVASMDDAISLSKLMEADTRSDVRTAIARRIAALGSQA